MWSLRPCCTHHSLRVLRPAAPSRTADCCLLLCSPLCTHAPTATAAKVAASIRAGGGKFVDGGIVGGPAWAGNGKADDATRMYLSGEGAGDIAALFEGTHLGVPLVEGAGETGASAMKIAYASWTKGSSALLINVNAFAKAAGVHASLISEWTRSEPHKALARSNGSKGVGPKAWRWIGEMQEIAAS